MIAINIPRRRIVFRAGQTDEEKVNLLWDIWWDSKMLLSFICPVTSDEKNIPDVIEFQEDKNYGLV